MKVTTVRFGTDLWALLETEADRVGVSTSQYIREAALARAAAAAAARGASPFDLLAASARDLLRADPDPTERRAAGRALAALARSVADESVSDARAVTAQSEQSMRRAGDVRRKANRLARKKR